MPNLEDKHLQRFKQLIDKAQTALLAAQELLTSLVGEEELPTNLKNLKEEVVIEGVFDGQSMLADDGKNYPISANYASKSKLVEGDRMKLTISADGSFLYKQIQPTPRMQMVGVLSQKNDKYYVVANDKSYQVLVASVTHHKIKAGDQISISIPQNNPKALWAAIEAPL